MAIECDPQKLLLVRLEDRIIKLKLAEDIATKRLYSWCGQLEQPANVCRRNEVPGRPHYVRPKYRALIKVLLNAGIVGF